MTVRTFFLLFAVTLVAAGCAYPGGGGTSPQMYPPQPYSGYTTQQVDQARLDAEAYSYEVEQPRLYNRGARDAIGTERLYNRQLYQTQKESIDLNRQRIRNVDQLGRTIERWHKIYERW